MEHNDKTMIGTTIIMIRKNNQVVIAGDGQVTSNDWYARSAGTHGNSLRLEVCPSATAYEQDCGVGNLVNGAGAVGDTSITVDDAVIPNLPAAPAN